MYESKSQKPLVPAAFRSRLVAHLAAALGLVAFSLAIGMAGYMALEALTPIDAFLNASMLLGGMGPVTTPLSWGGKLFAGCYALYAGLVFIATAALVFTPVLHRVIHRFHWDSKV
jgi:hypothetical protein